MFKFIFKSAGGSFLRTIGRILAYILIGGAILYFSGFARMASVNALSSISHYYVTTNRDYDIPDFNTGTLGVVKGTTGYFPFKTIITYKEPMDIANYQIVHYVDFCYNGELKTGTHTATDIYGVTVNLYVNSSGSCSRSGYNKYSFKYVWNAKSVQYDDGAYGWAMNVTFNELLVQDKNSHKYIGYLEPHTFISGSDEETTYLQQIETNEKLDDLNQNQQQTNEKLDDLNSSITDDTPPSVDGLDNVAGWLPAGPIDSLLNLPLTMFNSLLNGVGSTCQPVTLKLPYVNKNVTLPCLNSIYSQIDGLTVWINSIAVIAAGFILYAYFMKLYKWVDDTLSLREKTQMDWGGV